MNQVRIHGDPFGDDAAASLLRCFLRLALGSGVRCSLSLAAVEPRSVRAGERTVSLTDGVRDLRVGTLLPAAETDLLLRAANEVVASSAPVLVFALPQRRADAAREAGLSWPRATAVLPARDGATAADLLERVRAELRWAGVENPPHALEPRELAPWLALPVVAPGGPVVTVVGDVADDGFDLVAAAWRQHFAANGPRLRVVVTAADPVVAGVIAAMLGDAVVHAELVVANFEPAQVRDAVAVWLPWRRHRASRTLVQALASGRPVAASRFAAVAPLLAAPGTCQPIGGRNVPAEPGVPAHFAPHRAAVVAALRVAIADAATAVDFGRRARAFVVEELVRGRPASPPPPVPAAAAPRPSIVLEAPLFETSSSAELTIETARALCRRDRVDVRLVPTSPHRARLADFRNRAPELEALLCRDPGDVDLWLAAGWPVRAARPACRTWALRIDQEYGTLPVELTPHATQDADVVVVHSEHVHRTLAAAGRALAGIEVIPHGVDPEMHEDAPPCAEILAHKQGLPAVLFCGGMIWRKGFDVFLGAALAAWTAGARFAVVVKAVGQDQHYGRFHLGELLQRFRATANTPPVLLLDRDLSRRELAGVYTACDLLLHPYRGEGFCLPLLEARACGLPVLATAGGATEPLLAGPGAIRIPSRRRAVELPAPHVAPPWVLEPSAEAAGELLASALSGLPALQHASRAFAPSVRSAYRWDAAAVALENLAFAAAGKRRLALPAGEPVFTLPATGARAAAEAAEPVRGMA